MADAAPLVSIVMAARNAATTIEAAIDSAVAQDLREWELIVIDDGSTDSTAQIVAAYAAGDPRIRMIAGAGEGASAARNRGIAVARGRWLAFLDSDDWWEADFLSTMTAALDGQPDNAVAYCGYWRVMPDGSLTPPKVDPRVARAPFESFAMPCPVTIHTLLLDRASVIAAGAFDTSLTTCEDWDLWQRLARAGAPWVMVDRPLAYYRASTGSLTRLSRAMLADGRVVIDRAYRADPRVAQPLPQFANGLTKNIEGQRADEVYAWFALWTMVIARIDGDETAFDTALLAPLNRSSDWTKWVATAILDAATVGMRMTIPDMAAHWDRLGPAVRWAIAQVAAAWGTPEAALRLQYAVEAQLLTASDDDPATRTLDRTIRVHVEVGSPAPLMLPGEVDRVYAIFVDRDERLASLMLGVVGDMTVSDWRELIPYLAPDWIDATLREDRWAAAPQIARAAVRTALRRPGVLRSPSRIRGAMRQAVVEGVTKLANHHAPLPNSHRGRLRELVRAAEAEAAAYDGARTANDGNRLQGADAGATTAERPLKLPILMYHGVAPDGAAGLSRWRLQPEQFRDQLGWLRANGYQALTSGQVEWHLQTGTPFYGRPVWITFDDGYQDFADFAWPILREHGFVAEMFIVTGAMGGTAFWDAALGEPPRLMDAPTIARLAGEGVKFGSHFHDHRAADTLTSRELAQTLARSRAWLARITGEAPIAFAAPYMVPDTRLAPMAAGLGYRIGFGAESGPASLDSPVRDLPRIEVDSDMSLDQFAAMMEAARA